MSQEKFETSKPDGQEKPKPKAICAWCKKEIGEVEGTEGKDSHGICEECLKKYFPESEGSE